LNNGAISEPANTLVFHIGAIDDTGAFPGPHTMHTVSPVVRFARVIEGTSFLASAHLPRRLTAVKAIRGTRVWFKGSE
jgi:hypothetical protein